MPNFGHSGEIGGLPISLALPGEDSAPELTGEKKGEETYERGYDV